jgi:ATP-dependent exoDNAse (exonuclease V) beta subunit
MSQSVDERTLEREREPQRQVWRVVPESAHTSAPNWVVGRIVHEAVAAWRFPDHLQFEDWAHARARAHGIADPRQLHQATTEAKRLLRRFQDHRFYGEMRVADLRLHEVEYSVVVDGDVQNGAIDVLYRHDNLWTLVEIKSDQVKRGETPEQLQKYSQYVDQAQRYGAAFCRLLGQRPSVYLCFLNTPDSAQDRRIHPE